MSAPKPNRLDRFWSRVNQSAPGGCWEWTASLRDGYGQLRVGIGSPERAHRFSWQLHHGAIPNGLLVLHKCDNRKCVNPDHLFLGTQLDNMRDMFAKGRGNPGPGGRAAMTQKWAAVRARGERATHCHKGHEYAIDGRVSSRGWHVCLACRREADRLRRTGT